MKAILNFRYGLMALLLVVCFNFSAMAKEPSHTLTKDDLMKSIEQIRMNEESNIPTYVKFKEEAQFKFSEAMTPIRLLLNMQKDDELQLYQTDKDEIGYTHYRYSQSYKGIPVEGSMIIVHVKEGKVVSFNGDFSPNINISFVIFNYYISNDKHLCVY